MLILTRKVGESITIGEEIRVCVLEIRGHQVRIGVDAPRRIAVHREEIFRLIQAGIPQRTESSPGEEKEEVQEEAREEVENEVEEEVEEEVQEKARNDS